MRSLLLSLVAIAFVGCAHPSLDRPYVAGLELRGVRNVDKHELARGLASRPSPWWKHEARPYSELELARDRMRVTRFYEENGYYATRVVLAEARPGAKQNARDVVIAVEEGPVTLIGDVRVMGMADVDATTKEMAHKAQLGLRRGQVFHHADYERFKDDVLQLLRKRGYPNAAVVGLVDIVPRDNLANITVTANASGAEKDTP